ncbi:MAG: PSD1 and planctomycete cytochrome C domain-containing protein [Pirellulales bacterium]
MSLRQTVVLIGWTVCSSSLAAVAAEPVDFQREIQPILAEHCTQCHGVDADDRKGGLRLDLRDGALRGGDSGQPAVSPGQPDKSELLRRVRSTDPDEVMPPPNQNKPLSAQQKELLRRWIENDAPYASHWAFDAPRKAAPPNAGGPSPNPVDAFVRTKLAQRGVAPSPPAAPHELCRRLYLDLIGLPPSPQELAAFQRDGYEKTVDALLASERFGEKWARHWLDAARYSDTNGYEKDLQREQWKWRDWVVDALNRDMPYDQFLIEQIAGDLLPNATPSQIIATGFLRNSMINEEGAIVAEQFRMVEMFDRLDCIGKAILGLTTQCAQCHSHKFDPLTHDEYYGLFAFLNNSYEAQSWVYTDEQRKQIDELRRQVDQIEGRWKASRPDGAGELNRWAAQTAAAQLRWSPIIAAEMGSISGLNHPTQEADGSLLMKGHTSNDVFLIASPDLQGVTGVRIEALNHRDLPHSGPGRSRFGTWAIQELEVLLKKPGGKDWEKQKLVNATADFSQPDQKQPDGKNARGPVEYLIDGKEDTFWVADRGPGLRNRPSVAVVQFEKPLDAPPGTQIKIAWRMSDMLGCARFSLTTAPQPVTPPIDYAAQLALAKPEADRTPDELTAITAAWRTSVPEAKAVSDEIAKLWAAFPQAPTSILHLAEREPANRRATYLLDRGNWDQPKREVQPHTPAAFHPFPADAPRNRLGFARWLADPRSPLTARVAVNRLWQAVWGVGLVETSEDFGTRAPAPEYRELLDWLAVDFMEHGWRQKHTLRTIVLSDAYRQSSRATRESLERDPANQLLARGPRFRADAEVVRDLALSAAGLLSNRLGGPSVIPPVPQNVLDYNYTYPGYWKPAEGPDRYRRAVYVFRKRSMPDPALSNFDAPNADASCARRVRSNTPLAALTGLNEPIFVEAARGLALRVLREAGGDDGARADYAFQLCVARQPTAQERQAIVDFVRSRRQRLADGWLNAREIATGDVSRLPSLPEKATPQDAAAWTLAARLLLNLDETLTKN